MLHVPATSILGCTATFSALLLLYTTLLVPARGALLRENVTYLAPAANLTCSDPATNLCIGKLIRDELIPLQDFVANGSNLLKTADQFFVERVWAYVQVSAKDPVTATISELTDIERTLSHLHITWNLIRQVLSKLELCISIPPSLHMIAILLHFHLLNLHIHTYTDGHNPSSPTAEKKVNAMTMNLTQSQAYVEGGVGLLEEVMAVLQQQIKLNISSAIMLSIHSEELLATAQETLEEVYRLSSELNLTLCQVSNSVSHISSSSQDIDITAISTTTDMLKNAVEILTLEKSTYQQVQNVTRKVSMVTDGIREVGHVLKELNTVVEMGKLILTRANKTEMVCSHYCDEFPQDILQELFEFEELSKSMETLVSVTDGVVHNASVIITIVFQLIQNVSYTVNASTNMLIEHMMFKERLPALEIGADAAIQHALEIFHQVQGITQLGTAFLNDEFTDEFDRLSIINTTATEAIMTIPSSLLIHTSNVGQLLNSTDVIITRARLLQQSATNITSPSLTVLAQQFDKGLTQYDGVHTTYMDIVQGVVSFEQIQSTIDEVLLDHIAHLDLIQNSIDSANETWNGVLSMLKSINSTVIVTEINQNTSNSIEILNQTMNNFSEVTVNQHSLEGELLNLSLSFQQLADTQSSLNDMLNRASSIVSQTYTITDQIDLPLEFDGDQVLVIALGSEEPINPLISGQFRSLSLQFTANNISDSIIVHLISSRGNQARTELLVELFDSQLKVLFRDVNARGQEFSLSITVSESELETNRTYSVFISRTESNVHVELTDLQSSEVFTVHRLASNRLRRAFSILSFLASATLYIGGNSPLDQDRSYFSGCLSNVHINGGHLNVWSLAVNTGQMDLHVCSMNHLVTGDNGKVQLLLDEAHRFAQQWVNGSFLPVVIELQTQLPNGLILYTHSQSSEPILNSFSVYLELGKIEMRVVAGDGQRTLTSSQTYYNGALHTIKIDLEGSRLVLRTEKEVVTKRLQTATISSLSTYSELLVGGVGVRVREDEGVDESNFTGCVSVLSMSSVVKVPKCYKQEIIECIYCSQHETVISAEFYGTSYVQFPTFTANEYLDITLNFRTYFANGLVLFIGNAAQNMWLALALNDGDLNLLFQAGANTPLGISEGTGLDDGSMHTVTVIRSGSSLSITVDEDTVASPFGSSFPSGSFSSDLFIGGIARSHTNLLYAGAFWDGFKGCLDSIRINGKILDFSENLASEEITFVVEDKFSAIQGQNGQDFYFNGLSSFAEFDIRRFPENFSLGFQFNAASEDGLLFYVFSRRREDKMAIQLNHTTLQLYTLESISGFERTVSLSQEITLRQWHDVKIIEQGERISMTLDGNLTLQESLTLPNPLRTTSPLYIGGLPSDQRIPLSSSVVTEHFTGCLRTHYLSLATIRHEVEMNSCEGSSL